MSKQIRVLVVDDDEEFREQVREYLAKVGFDVFAAGGGEEALDVARSQKVHLIVLDVMMARFNGWEVCKYLRGQKAYDNVGIIMLTGIGRQLNDMTSPLYGADSWLDKPVDFLALFNAVVTVLRTRCNIELL